MLATRGRGRPSRPNSKLIVSWLVGARDGEYALAFIDDLRQRLANRVQLTSDGHKAYLEAVEEAFGDDIDYAMLVKLYGDGPDGRRSGRYSPATASDARERADHRQSRSASTSARATSSGRT